MSKLVVTGGANGIGKGIVRALLDAGARVVIADIEEPVLAETLAELGDRGRVLIRYSGTELKARIMVEGEDERVVRSHAEALADTLRKALAREGDV